VKALGSTRIFKILASGAVAVYPQKKTDGPMKQALAVTLGRETVVLLNDAIAERVERTFHAGEVLVSAGHAAAGGYREHVDGELRRVDRKTNCHSRFSSV
jgi:hypothetical protein